MDSIPIEQDDFVTWLCERETAISGHAGTRFGSPLVEWLSSLFRSECAIENASCCWMSFDCRWRWRELPAWSLRFQAKIEGYTFRPLTGLEAFEILASVELSMRAQQRSHTGHRKRKLLYGSYAKRCPES